MSARFARPNQAFRWVQARDGQIPPDAVQGGCEEDGRPLYIARQYHEGGLHLGKAAPHIKGLLMPYGMKEHFYKEYYVLCGDARGLRWVECRGKATPQGWSPLEAGNESDGTELYVAKFRYKGGEQIGKAGPGFRDGCAFGYGMKEHYTSGQDQYFVLANPF
jgi:hypothetical protein